MKGKDAWEDAYTNLVWGFLTRFLDDLWRRFAPWQDKTFGPYLRTSVGFPSVKCQGPSRSWDPDRVCIRSSAVAKRNASAGKPKPQGVENTGPKPRDSQDRIPACISGLLSSGRGSAQVLGKPPPGGGGGGGKKI